MCIRDRKGTGGTETSKYPEEKKETSISKVAASEMERAQTVVRAPRGCGLHKVCLLYTSLMGSARKMTADSSTSLGWLKKRAISGEQPISAIAVT